MSSQIHVVALITPAPGKEARLRELLQNIAKNVQAKEYDVSKYHLFEQTNGEGVNIFMVEETYDNQAAYDNHFKTDYVTALGEAIPKENLVSAPLDIKTIKPIGGFASRS